jgi:hypothetical protein
VRRSSASEREGRAARLAASSAPRFSSPHVVVPAVRVPVIVLVADGARPDAFEGTSLDTLPALRRLRDEGALHRVASVFPSVTGPAYTPFLLGRFPGPIGIPGLRWYDRERETCGWPDYARSYVGHQMRRFDDDLDACAPTIFELVPNSLAALSVVTRGLAASHRIGALTPSLALRATLTHFRGLAERWLDVDRETADVIVQRMHEDRPDFLFAAFTGVDKASHARGHDDPLVHDALHIVNDAATRLREDAERGGWWEDTHLWIVSDHGHSAVHTHEDLAVMVSGNAMAHLYLDLDECERPWWPALAERHGELADALLDREAVDLMLLPLRAARCVVRSARRGSAIVEQEGTTFRYRRESGDPLGVGADLSGSADETFDAMRDGDYPDAIVQIATLAASSRAGDIILSATPGWDFRARYEPIPHRSAHGALHRDHMLVPLLTNRPTVRTPRRTTDVFASALAALGVAAPERMDGESFL